MSSSSTDALFARRLRSLGHFDPDGFNANDKRQFRRCVVWLEDQRIRFYRMDERAPLRDVDADRWDDVFAKYLDRLGCLESMNKSRKTQLMWLIGRAVQLEYAKDPKVYNNLPAEDTSKQEKKSQNPLDGVDVHSNKFKEQVTQLCTTLNIPFHSNHLVSFEACCILIQEKLKEAQRNKDKNPAEKTQGQKISLSQHSLGVPEELREDPGLYQSLQILRLIHLRELRDLQDEINNTIECVQAITANPKTDTKLGKVGR